MRENALAHALAAGACSAAGILPLHSNQALIRRCCSGRSTPPRRRSRAGGIGRQLETVGDNLALRHLGRRPDGQPHLLIDYTQFGGGQDFRHAARQPMANRGRHRVAVITMTDMQTAPSIGFTPSERAYIRTELDIFFSTLPTVAEGFQLKTWRSGPDRGKPKLSPVAKG